MSTLLLRFAAPLQAWGTESKYDIRKTDREPSKSGVIGFIAAALGRRRTESVEDLNELRVGVRVDQEGEILQDLHTVHTEKTSYLTRRYYLSDAVFVVGVESGRNELLKEIAEAVMNPAFPLFLGRRSCPPCGKIILGIRDMGLEEALISEPWQANEWNQKKQGKKDILRIIIESDNGKAIKRDVAISFDSCCRTYKLRRVDEKMVAVQSKLEETQHDPMSEL